MVVNEGLESLVDILVDNLHIVVSLGVASDTKLLLYPQEFV